MNDPLDQKIRELAWQGRRTEAEEAGLRAYLAAHPEAAAEWETELALSRVLDRLPESPVASNFTARVLQTVEREVARAARVPEPRRLVRWWRWQWLPKAAAAALVVGVGWFAHQVREKAQRAQLAESVVAVSSVAGVPSPDFLQDFEAIRRLSTAPPADEELLALLR